MVELAFHQVEADSKKRSIYSVKVTSVMKKNAAKKGTGYFTVGKEGRERLQFKRLPSMSR